MPLLDFNEVWIEIKTTIELVLRKHLKDAKDDFAAEINEYIPKISEDAARYATKAASGDPDAKIAMDHLIVQSRNLAAIIGQREQNHAAETMTLILTTVAKILGEVLKKVLM